MKLSARNQLKGTVVEVKDGAINTEITLELAPGVRITSVITMDSARRLDLKEGKEVYAVVKSSNVLLAVDD